MRYNPHQLCLILPSLDTHRPTPQPDDEHWQVLSSDPNSIFGSAQSPYNKDAREREKGQRSAPIAVSILNTLNLRFMPTPTNLDAS